MWSIYFLVIFSPTVAFHLSPPFDLRIDYYKVETTHDLAIHKPRPEWSWKVSSSMNRNIQQTAYQIQIKSDHSQWDSGRIISKQSLHVLHRDRNDLHSATYYRFRLRVWTTESNQSSQWTDWIRFRTSIFNLHEFLTEQKDKISWIGSTEICMNELRKEFNITHLSPIRSATALVSGLGYYELYINGEQVDPSRKLDPGWTTYEKRTLFVSFDLTSNVKTGMNAIGIKLGNGWYSEEQYLLSSKSGPTYGPPRLFFMLHIIFENSEEMQVYSDQTWTGRQGSIVYDSIYNGEIIDARYDRPHWSEVGFQDRLSLWLTPEIMPSPINRTINGQFTLQDMPPIRAGPDALHFEVDRNLFQSINGLHGAPLATDGILKPISVSTPVSGVYIFDLGQNMVGWCRIQFRGPRGIGVQIRHAEILSQPVVSTGQSSGEIFTENLRSARQTDTYILRGDTNGEIYEPRFTVHGFRYISVVGSPNSLSVNDVECPIVHSETTVKGHFSSSNPVMNQIQHNIQWGQLSSLMSIPTDCPQRDERKGWLGDVSLTVDEALYNFDLIKFYLNFLNLIIDIQSNDGSIPDTVPFTSGSYPADPNWGTALPTITWQLYRHYQNKEILRTYYPNIRSYIEGVRSEYNQTGLLHLNYHYGDWVPPPPQPMTDAHLVSSFAFLHDIIILINMSRILAISKDTEIYSLFYQQLSEEFHRVFFEPSSNFYADGMQAAQILALTLPNVVPERLRETILQYLVRDIQEKGIHLTTGIISTAQLFPLLSDHGYHDLAVELISSINYPSYRYMFNNPYENATTLWELWNAPFAGSTMNSRNHIMFGSVGGWFYSHLAGIDLQTDAIIIRPRMISEKNKNILSRLNCQLSTLYGLVHVSYTRDEEETFPNSILLRITIPSNLKVTVIFEPLFSQARCVMLTEGNNVIWSDVRSDIDRESEIRRDEKTGVITVQIGSGQYVYQAFWI